MEDLGYLEGHQGLDKRPDRVLLQSANLICVYMQKSLPLFE